MSYVTGSHSIKVGLQWKYGWIKNTVTQNGNMVQVYNNGAPLQVRVYNTPIESRANLNGDTGIYIQDSWHISRLTLSPGIRWERFNAEVAEQTRAGGPVRRGPSFRRDQEPAELQELGAPSGRCLRPASATAGPVSSSASAATCSRMRAAFRRPTTRWRRRTAESVVDRLEQRRHRAGRARLRVSDAWLRDQFRAAVEHLRRAPQQESATRISSGRIQMVYNAGIIQELVRASASR